MPAHAYRRFLKRQGRDATLYEVSSSGTDDWGDATTVTASTTETHALVRYRGGEGRTVTVAGEVIEVDAEIIVPDDLSVDPEANNHRPELEIGGERYKIWVVDDSAVEGGCRLLCTRT